MSPKPTTSPKKIESLARGIAIRDGHILLCRNRDADYWYLPGGHIEPGETAAEALHREFKEETGAKVRLGNLVLIHEHLFHQHQKPRHEYSYCYLVAAPTRIRSREDHLQVEWVKQNRAIQLDVRPNAMMKWIGVFLEEHPRGITFLTTRQRGAGRRRR